MRNKMIFISLILSIILLICLAVFGIKIGKLEIPSISKLIDKNKQINSSIEQVSKLTSSDYPEQISNLEGTINDLNVQKQKYEQLSGFSSPEEGSIYETEKFDISYLWTTIGEYASKEGITLAMDVKKGTGADLYNLDFTVQGTYTHLSTFITTIENDSKLSFRIYNFKLVPGSDNVNLKATFTVKDVNIDDSSLIKNSSSIGSSSSLSRNLGNKSTNETTTNSSDNTSNNATENTAQ